MILARLCLSTALVLGAATAVSAFDQRDVGPGHLAPIVKDYRAKIASWGRFFYADPGPLQAARISDPVLIRDGTGRLMWLVCLDVPSRLEAGIDRHAFGFAPNYFSAPTERRYATLTRDDCNERALAYRPFREAAAPRARRR